MQLKLKMAPNSLFAILLRSPWWASLGLAVVLSLLARLLLPERFAVAGMLGSFPFVVIAAVAAWKQIRAPSAAQVHDTLQRLAALSTREFGQAVEAAFRSRGHAVQRLNAGGAEIELSKDGQRTLVAIRRWKAARTGIEPLRQLHAAQLRHGADHGLYIGGGEFSEAALAFAKQMDIRLMDNAGLAQLMRGSLPAAGR